MSDDQQPPASTPSPTTTEPADEQQPANREELEWVWCLAQPSYSQDVWMRLWRTYGDRSLRPRQPTTAYRAAFPGGEREMSWAPNRADAEHYVTPAKGGQARRIYRTTLQPSAVVGVVSSTGEIVVDPRRLGRVVDVTDSTEGTSSRTQRRADEGAQQRRAAEGAQDRRRQRRQAERDVLERSRARARARRAPLRQKDRTAARPSARERIEQLAVQRDTQAALARSQTYLAQLEQDHAVTLAELAQAEQDHAAHLAQVEQVRAATLAELQALAATDPQELLQRALQARQEKAR